MGLNSAVWGKSRPETVGFWKRAPPPLRVRGGRERERWAADRPQRRGELGGPGGGRGGGRATLDFPAGMTSA